jgi:NADPH:quinone reductase-like Zn-dependent oxidoreductase
MHTHAWRLTPDGEYHWERVELPPLQAGEALIRLRACGLCTGEVMDWYTLRKAPLTPGHELVGEIEALGEGVQGAGGRRARGGASSCAVPAVRLVSARGVRALPHLATHEADPRRAKRAVHRARRLCG